MGQFNYRAELKRLKMELERQIRKYAEQNWPQRKISKELGVSLGLVNKVIKTSA